MFKYLDRAWKLNATITVFLSLVTGIQYTQGFYFAALIAAFSTGFGLASTIACVLLDIEALRTVPYRANRYEYTRK